MWMQAMSQVVLTPALICAVDQNDIKGLSIHFKAGKTQVDIFCCKRPKQQHGGSGNAKMKLKPQFPFPAPTPSPLAPCLRFPNPGRLTAVN